MMPLGGVFGLLRSSSPFFNLRVTLETNSRRLKISMDWIVSLVLLCCLPSLWLDMRGFLMVSAPSMVLVLSHEGEENISESAYPFILFGLSCTLLVVSDFCEEDSEGKSRIIPAASGSWIIQLLGEGLLLLMTWLIILGPPGRTMSEAQYCGLLSARGDFSLGFLLPKCFSTNSFVSFTCKPF